MGFSQQQTGIRDFDLQDKVDRQIIREFEAELEKYEAREPIVVMQNTIFEKKLFGYDILLHEQGLLSYTNKYPNGAVSWPKLHIFQETERKKKAVDRLRWGRKEAQEDERRRLQGTPIGEAMDMLGGRVEISDSEVVAKVGDRINTVNPKEEKPKKKKK